MTPPLERRTLLVALLLACASSGRAGKFDEAESEEAVPVVRISGLLDARFYSTGRDVSWMRGGSSPLRYGGRDTDGNGLGDRRTAGASVAQASLVVDAAVRPNAAVHVQANFTSDSSTGTNGFGIIEAYGTAGASLDKDVFRLRAGAFIPRISWEHPNTAWSTRYSLTPSAIGSWIGEEVRATGVEGVWERELPAGSQSRLTGGVFSGGDQVGRLLWFRGWSLSDYQADLAAQYTVLGARYSPQVELDGRPGYFGRMDLSLADRLVQIGGGYWTNGADRAIGQPAVLDTQAFRTRFWHFGGKLEWRRLTLIGQGMKATVSAVAKPARDWNSAYGLASLALGSARLSARYDRFWVLNWENGHALTGYAAWNFGVNQELGAEFVYTNCRPQQATRPRAQVERLAQLNYRFRFGKGQ